MKSLERRRAPRHGPCVPAASVAAYRSNAREASGGGTVRLPLVRSYAGIPSRPGYRARRVRAPRAPTRLASLGAMCPGSASARPPRVVPARTVAGPGPGVRPPAPRLCHAAHRRPTRHRAARFVYPAAASRLRSDRPRAAGAGSVRPCRRYPVRNGFRGGAGDRDRRAGHDSLPRIHVRVTKRARRATEIELSAALTLTVQRPPQQHPGQTKPPTHARQQAHTRRGIRTGAQSPRYV